MQQWSLEPTCKCKRARIRMRHASWPHASQQTKVKSVRLTSSHSIKRLHVGLRVRGKLLMQARAHSHVPPSRRKVRMIYRASSYILGGP